MYAVFLLQAHVLSLMAWADGVVSPEERLTFQEFLSAAPGRESQVAELLGIIEQPPCEEEVATMVQEAPASVAMAVLKMAYVLALSDGEFDETERTLLVKLASAMGVDEGSIETFFKLLELSGRAHKLEQSLLSSLSGEASQGG